MGIQWRYNRIYHQQDVSKNMGYPMLPQIRVVDWIAKMMLHGPMDFRVQYFQTNPCEYNVYISSAKLIKLVKLEDWCSKIDQTGAVWSTVQTKVQVRLHDIMDMDGSLLARAIHEPTSPLRMSKWPIEQLTVCYNGFHTHISIYRHIHIYICTYIYICRHTDIQINIYLYLHM